MVGFPRLAGIAFPVVLDYWQGKCTLDRLIDLILVHPRDVAIPLLLKRRRSLALFIISEPPTRGR